MPEAFGADFGDALVLSDGEVCRPCNNGPLAQLDRALASDFDIHRFFKGARGKRGRAAKIASRGNILSDHDESGPRLIVNLERFAVTAPDGTRLPGVRSGPRAASGRFSLKDKRFTLTVEIGTDPRFARGVTKIALELLAKYHGRERALEAAFDPVRSFVLTGLPLRRVLMVPATDGTTDIHVWSPLERPGHGFVARVRLCGAEFLVDLTPEQSVLTPLLEKVTGQPHALLPPGAGQRRGSRRTRRRPR